MLISGVSGPVRVGPEGTPVTRLALPGFNFKSIKIKQSRQLVFPLSIGGRALFCSW